MRLKLITASSLLLLSLACAERALIPEPAPGSVLVSDRLSNQKVNSFAEDADGHIWIGTFRGLNRYDIHDYHQYFCTDDTLGLPDNQVNKVLCDRDGRLWAATVNGIAFRTPDGRFHRVDVPDGNHNISEIFQTREGKLLFSNGVKLFWYDAASDRLRLGIRELGAFGAPSTLLDSEDRLWVNAGGELRVYNATDFSLLSTTPLPFLCYHICDAGSGELWLSGMGSLGILDKDSLTWKELPSAIRNTPGLMNGDIDIIYSIDGRSILLHVIGKGMYYYYRTRESVLFQDEDGFPFTLPDAEIRTIFRDSHSNLWFGTTDQGYTVSYQYNHQFNSNKYLTEAFAHKSVTALELDKAGNLWISTLRDGLFCYHQENRQLKKVDIEPLVQDKAVGYIRCSSVFCDSEGELWLVLTDKYRVLRCRYDGKKLSAIDRVDFYNPISVTEDDQGHIWIGGFGTGLLRYDKIARSTTAVELPTVSGWTLVS